MAHIQCQNLLNKLIHLANEGFDTKCAPYISKATSIDSIKHFYREISTTCIPLSFYSHFSYLTKHVVYAPTKFT